MLSAGSGQRGNQQGQTVLPAGVRICPSLRSWLAAWNVTGAANRRGVFVVIATFMLTALFGFLALATDMGWLYHQRRRTQAAADAGALYGAHQIRRGAATQTGVESLSDHGAFKGASDNGFTNGVDGAVVTVSYPPASGDYTTSNAGVAVSNKAVEVMVCQQQRTFFMPIFGVKSADVCARAVAGYLGQGEGCIYALNPTDPKSMYVHSNTIANIGCGVIVNSTDPGGLDVTSDACLHATVISVAGSDSTTDDPGADKCEYGNAMTVSTSPYYGTPREPDPLALLGVPPEVNNGCDHTQFVLDNATKIGDLVPGRYCKGLKIDCDTCGTITMPPGNYVIAGEKLEIVGNTTVEGSGVMIYATDFPADVISAKGILIASGPTVTLSAPTSGDFEGIVLYVDRALNPASPTFANLKR